MERRLTEKKPSKLFTEYYGTVYFVAVFVFLTAVAFVLRPMLLEVRATNADIASSLVALQQDRKYLDSLEQSIVAAQNIPARVLDQVDRALPREPKIPELLALFGTASERDGVQIGNISFTESRPRATGQRSATTTVSDMQINLSVKASSYPRIKRFLRNLEASLRILDVTGINVSTAAEEASTYAIQLKTYIYMPPAASKPTPTQR